jgi:predicted TIM-barrel fold metal-dependent hydrolase
MGKYKYRVVDSDAHYMEGLDQLVDYFPEPWKSRMIGSSGKDKASIAGIYPISTGDRSVFGRIQRDEFTEMQRNAGGFTPEIIPDVMEFLGVDAINMLSQKMLTFSRIKGDDPRATLLANAYTDYMLDKVVNPDEGIYTMAPLPFQEPKEAVELIDRVSHEKGIIGGCFVTAGPEPPFGNRKYDPIYEAAEANNLPIVFHAGGGGIDEFVNAGYEKFIETHVLGFLMANQSQITSLVIQGIPEKFPNLKIVFQESGVFWIPLMMHRLDTEYLKRQSEAPLLTKKPSEYIKDMYFGIQPLEVPEDLSYLRQIIDMIGGTDRLLYASDYPHWDYDPPSAITDLSILSEDEKQRVLSGTAHEVFGI